MSSVPHFFDEPPAPPVISSRRNLQGSNSVAKKMFISPISILQIAAAIFLAMFLLNLVVSSQKAKREKQEIRQWIDGLKQPMEVHGLNRPHQKH